MRGRTPRGTVCAWLDAALGWTLAVVNGDVMTTERSQRALSKDQSGHEVSFVSYAKLLFIWPVIVAGLAFWPLAGGGGVGADTSGGVAEVQPDEPVDVANVEGESPEGEDAALSGGSIAPGEPVSGRLEVLGWVYIWTMVVVLLTLGVDIDRNKAIFWLVLVAGVYVLGLWLQDVKGFTFFGDIYRWFAGLEVQYDRQLGLALSIITLVPFVIMLFWARLNDRWRITHNEFEHYCFGKMNDSLGRGAKTIRTDFPDVLELLLGLAGTLIVYNATGTRELRRIPHIMFLPLIRQRLNKILEKTSITAGEMEEEEDDDEQ